MKQDGYSREERLVHLHAQLDEVIFRLRDERDVDTLREILDEIEELEPMDDQFDEEAGLKRLWQAYEEQQVENAFRMEKQAKRGKYKSKMMVALVAVFTLCFASMAFGNKNLFETFVQWTDEVFKQTTSDNEDDVPTFTIDSDGKRVYASYEFVEQEFGIDIMQPTWIPEGFSFQGISVGDSRGYFAAKYLNDLDEAQSIKYVFTMEEEDAKKELSSEKEEFDAKVYSDGNIEYFIAVNEEWASAAWNYKGLSYTVHGFTSYEEALQFLEQLE